MCWVWMEPDSEFGALFEFTDDSLGLEALSDKPIVPGSVRAVFHSRDALKHFKNLHCPPMGPDIVVDDVWKNIILQFVPSDRVQFYPVTLIARGEIYNGFQWVIPFDRVACIDVRKSSFTSIIHEGDKTDYNGPHEIVHLPDCLQGKHLARDTNVITHCVVSNELHNALAATGESSMFFRPEDFPLTMRDWDGAVRET